MLLAASGDVGPAGALLRESLVLSHRINNPWDIMVALLSLGALAGTTGSPELGARLFGAGEALRDSKGLIVPVTFQGLYERTTSDVRRALGEAAFAASMAAGAALPLAEAVAEALTVGG